LKIHYLDIACTESVCTILAVWQAALLFIVILLLNVLYLKPIERWKVTNYRFLTVSLPFKTAKVKREMTLLKVSAKM